MSNLIEKINSLLTYFLYKIGMKKHVLKSEGDSRALGAQPFKAPQLVSNAHALLVHHNDNVALVVDHEFKDVPSWIEWDVARKRISIAQMGGGMTELDTALDEKQIGEYKKRKKIYLIANHEGEKIVHSLALIVRE